MYTVDITGYCKLYTDSIYVNNYNIPSFNSEVENHSLCIENMYYEYVIPDYNAYKWTLNSQPYTLPIVRIVDTGQYQLIATEMICNTSDTINLYFDAEFCEKCVQVPNAFSPNNDGLNDQLRIFTYCAFSKFEFKFLIDLDRLSLQQWIQMKNGMEHLMVNH